MDPLGLRHRSPATPTHPRRQTGPVFLSERRPGPTRRPVAADCAPPPAAPGSATTAPASCSTSTPAGTSTSSAAKKVQKRYDIRGKPLAIFGGAWDSACTVDQFEDALLGNEQFLVNSGEIKRANSGFFGRNRERPAGKHQELSCVVALRGWRPWQPDNPSILRFDNPFAAVSFPDELLPADYRLGVVRDERKLWLDGTPTRPGLA
jgi:hypothetical protein